MQWEQTPELALLLRGDEAIGIKEPPHTVECGDGGSWMLVEIVPLHFGELQAKGVAKPVKEVCAHEH